MHAGLDADIAADDGEDNQAQRIEQQERPTQTVDQPSQRNGDQRRTAHQQQHIGVLHPNQRIVIEEDVAHCAAAQRGNAGDEADPEPVHVAPSRCQGGGHRFGRYGDVEGDEQHGRHPPRRNRVAWRTLRLHHLPVPRRGNKPHAPAPHCPSP
ncbi:hypothetical protein D3C87_1504130 [compost metagenome]